MKKFRILLVTCILVGIIGYVYAINSDSTQPNQKKEREEPQSSDFSESLDEKMAKLTTEQSEKFYRKMAQLVKESRIRPLRGLKGVVPKVYILGETSLGFPPADQKHLQSEVERKLRESGIKVYKERGGHSMNIAYFSVSVFVWEITAQYPIFSALEDKYLRESKIGNWIDLKFRVEQMLKANRKNEDKRIYMVSISAELKQEVSLLRNPKIHHDAVTWKAGMGPYDISERNLNNMVCDGVLAYTSMFIDDYLAANPKEETSAEFPEYFSEKHNFKVRFPGKVKVTEYGLVTHYTVEIEAEGAYNIIIDQSPKPILSDKAIQAALEGYLQGRLALFGDDADLLESHYIVFAGRKALQYEYTVESQGTLACFKGLYFIVGKFGYGVSCVCTEVTKPLVYSKYKDFVESFRIIESR